MFKNKKELKSIEDILVLISDTDISDLTIQILDSIKQSGLNPCVEIHDLGNPKIYHDLTELGFKCRKVKRHRKIFFPLAIIRLIFRISESKYKTVYSSGQYSCLIGLTSSFICRVPKRIYTRHHTDSNYSYSNRNLRMLRGFIFDKTCNLLATKIIAVSQVVKDFMITHENVFPGKVTVINNSVSKKFLADTASNVPSDKIRIGVVSRLTSIKGVEYIAEAFVAYYLENNNCQLTVVGADSDSSAAIHKILGQLPLEVYNFIPRLTDVHSFYNEIDVFIHAPISETAEAFGLVYLESLFAGLYCIFTKSGIIGKDEELQELCKIVDYKDSQSILQAIREYSFSAKTRKVIPQKVLQRYSTAKMKNSYSEIWKSKI